MNELLQALTRAATAVAVYYEQESLNPIKAAQRSAAAVAAPEAEAPVAAPGKVGRPKKEKIAEIVPVAPPAATPVAPLGEDDSLKEVRAAAKVYVQRFANQTDGIAAFRKFMTDTTKVAKIDELSHPQRIQLIAAVKAAVAEIDAKKPAASAGTEV